MPSIILFIAALLLGRVVPAKSSTNGLRVASRNVTSLLCHVTMEVVSMSANVIKRSRQQHHHFECSPVEKGFVSDYSYMVNLPTDFIEQHKADLTGGNLFVDIPGGMIDDGVVVVPNVSMITVGTAPDSFETRHRRLSATTGTRSVLVLRISSNDATPSFSAKQFYSYIFGDTNCSQPTLKSQFKRMSFGKLNLVPTKYGVMEVKVNKNAKGATSKTIRDVAIAEVISKYRVSSVTELADHVMLCIPPGTGDWAGSSPVGSWRLVLNNQWCGYVSGLVHEMGHNFGLLHANVGGVAYMDLTSYMSAGYATTYFPAKSFNGANNWQFGWYSDRHLTINPSLGGKVVTLATFVDYGKSNKKNPVLIKVGSETYLQYNLAKSFNYQSQQMINQVAVVQQLRNGTNMLGGVDPSSPKLTITNFDGSGRKLVIYACRSGAGSTSDPDWMEISIGYDQNFCSQGGSIKTEPRRPTTAPVRTFFVPARSPTKPTRGSVIPAPSKPSSSNTCHDSVNSFVVSGRGRKTCLWLGIRPVWQKKLCILQQVRSSCPKTCGGC